MAGRCSPASPTAADLVGPTLDRTPFFGYAVFGHRLRSYASVVRVGAPLTTGADPYYSARGRAPLFLAAIFLALALSGCAGIPVAVVYGLSAAASAVTIADRVLDIDTSLRQDKAGKVPLWTILGFP